jgi:hypothetical protein
MIQPATLDQPTTTGDIHMTTNTEQEVLFIDVNADEYAVADYAAATLARLRQLEPEIYYLRRELWFLSTWAAKHRPDVHTGVLRGVADLALGQIESRNVARQVRDIAATLPDPLG